MAIKTQFMPDILAGRLNFSPISVHRALKHIKSVIETLEPDGPRADEVQSALDDLELMIGAASNGRDLVVEQL